MALAEATPETAPKADPVAPPLSVLTPDAPGAQLRVEVAAPVAVCVKAPLPVAVLVPLLVALLKAAALVLPPSDAATDNVGCGDALPANEGVPPCEGEGAPEAETKATEKEGTDSAEGEGGVEKDGGAALGEGEDEGAPEGVGAEKHRVTTTAPGEPGAAQEPGATPPAPALGG